MTIELVTTDDLIAELKRRYPVMVMVDYTTLDTEREAERIEAVGPSLLIIGMLEILKQEIVDGYVEDCHDTDDLP